nr:MAG TPA: hypothetical protein [Caudoviricetes sp.]
MRDTTHAKVTRWTEYRTPSGRWSKIRYDETTEDFKPYNLRNFFSVKFPGERRSYGYTEHGYLPVGVTVPSPDGSKRRVYKFAYYKGPREVTTYTYED